VFRLTFGDTSGGFLQVSKISSSQQLIGRHTQNTPACVVNHLACFLCSGGCMFVVQAEHVLDTTPNIYTKVRIISLVNPGSSFRLYFNRAD
jgi:hypothetical protein